MRGTVRTLKNGKYQADVYDHAGKRRRVTFDNYKDANDFVTMIENEKKEYRRIALGLSKKKVTILKSTDRFFKTKKELKKKSRTKYEYVLKQFRIFCDQEKITYIQDLQRDQADKFWDYLTSTDAKPKTVNFYLMTVKSLFNYEMDRNSMDINPFSHIKRMKVKVKTQVERNEEYLNETEVKNFFKASMTKIERQVLTVLFLTGMRIEELSKLKWEHSIDMKEKMIKIREHDDFEAKTPSSIRDIPMTDTVYKIIKSLKGVQKEGYVFKTEKGNIIKERTYLEKCKKIAKEAGIKKNATLHKWRHTFASHAANTEITYEERQDLLGHKPESMTDRYTKIGPKKLHKKLSELDKLIK